MAEQSRKVFTNTTFIIVRHGEKLTWPDGKAPSRGAKKRYVDDTLLSAKGHERAFALVGYFLHRKEMTDLLKDRPLTTIIAQASDPRPNAAGKSQRPYQTIAPLLAALTAAAQTLPVSPAPFGHASAATVTGLPVDHLPFFKRDLVTMVRRLHAEAHRYTGATVLLSGAHQYFREIAIALGADATRVPAKWPGKRFDVTWVIDPEDPHRFRQYAQRLLWDDRSKVIKL
ncbi:hypothetical protein CXG81DRAFT_8854 [Caulochytrium protostelioides]|uniref:Phosphoglycerate mutase-like protein n=1 Tax=Caulochytrium protostelioides TaxID=1555241 RepID=A0A4P9XEK3_9FUNG|nr:hypothetical protein CXG81DRAFT_8854 [Caulochytrium protostelioides]|eukprot:RKP03987.1 hypothetical protein CXG81DRAFT_8854 [Caulochytrium protostelioides]